MLERLIERLISASAARGEELVAARAEWDELTGKVFDDDPLYEERTKGFLEWYALERVGLDKRSPLERLLANLPENDPDREGLRLLCNTHRSLFAVRRVKEPHLELQDLLGGCIFRVYERRTPLGLAEGDVFEARLCARAERTGEVLMTRALQHHPREARAVIEELAGTREPREETLFKLARLRWKAARWGHVAPERIYRGEDAAE
jgi:hypothetical protein